MSVEQRSKPPFLTRLKRAAQTPEVYQAGIGIGVFTDVLLHLSDGNTARQLFDIFVYTVMTYSNKEIRTGIAEELRHLREDIRALRKKHSRV
ncbi:hypothetical protein KJZ67_00325 [Patescibacteria group bacterium]|nr:hypothetical protein [Patescibacteria group bacterium]